MKRILTLIMLFAAVPSFAHQAPSGMEYDGWCCNGMDCAPIPAKRVRVVAGGYEITLQPGDHHMVTKPHVFTVKQTDAKPATDGSYHVCLYPDENTLRCFYAPPMGF